MIHIEVSYIGHEHLVGVAIGVGEVISDATVIGRLFA